MILRQTFSRHLYISTFIWATFIMGLLGWWYFNFDSDYLLILGIFYFLFTLPAIILHFEYTLKNWGEIVLVNGETITTINGNHKNSYEINDLAGLIIYRSASLDKYGIPLSAMEYYYYINVITKQGGQIIITCLMTRNFDEMIDLIPQIPIKRVNTIFASPRLNKAFKKGY